MPSFRILAALALSFAFSPACFAALAPGEPPFCELKTFQSLEIQNGDNLDIFRNHAFQIGNITLVGLAVGNSDTAAVQALANQFSQFDIQEKSCTWYFNDGNSKAARAFHHRYVSNPKNESPDEAANEFATILASSFANDSVSFTSCMANHGYLAMGCDGQRHRGPSAFAMFLSYVGCSPQNAVTIVNKIWGTNGVAIETREAIASRGRMLGLQNPSAQKQIQTMMGIK